MFGIRTSRSAGSTKWGAGFSRPNSFRAGGVTITKVNLGMRQYFAMAIRVLERRIFGKSYYPREKKSRQKASFLTSFHGSSLVVDTLCDRARGRNIAVTCFYFDFAAGKEQTSGSMLGALLKQVVGGLDKVPEDIMQEFAEQKKVIGGRSLRLDQIVKMLVAVTSLKRTFICVDAMDECAVRDRAKILISLGEIIQKSPTTRVFLTGRPHIRSEVETRLLGGAVAVSVSPWERDIIHYIRKRLEEDPSPDEMDESLESEIVQKIPETVSEM